MTKPKSAGKANRTKATTQPEANLGHLRREVRTALELAVVALAPMELIDRLATAAGLMEALIELPPDSPPALALLPGLVQRARRSLDDWRTWSRYNLERKMPRV